MKYSSFVLSAALAATLAGCGGGGGSAGGSAPITPPPSASANTPPMMSIVPKQTISQDAISDVITFDVTDAQSDPATIALSVQSSNSELLSTDAIALSGFGASRALILTPAAGMSGTATLTLIATDSQGATAQQAIAVTVTSEERSFREMVGTAYLKDAEAEGEQTVGYSLVDTAEDDEAAFDNLFTE